jgi:hypothetical protein
MSKKNTIVARRQSDGTIIQLLPDGSTMPLPDKTDWARLRAMTDEEVTVAAMSDPDAQPMTPSHSAPRADCHEPKLCAGLSRPDTGRIRGAARAYLTAPISAPQRLRVEVRSPTFQTHFRVLSFVP